MSVCDRWFDLPAFLSVAVGAVLVAALLGHAAAGAAGAPPALPGELWVPKEHPYLFFGKDDIPRLRELANGRGTHRVLAHLILRDADAYLNVPIPVEPEPGPLKREAPGGGYDSRWLSVHYEFYEYGHLMRSFPPILAFAYLLTGDEKYARRAKEWLLAYARWSRWGPLTTPADNQAAQAIIGFAITYDWIYEAMTPEERTIAREALAEQAEMFYAQHSYVANIAIEGRKGSLANNHSWQQQLGLAFPALALLYEVPEARRWLETEVTIVRDKLIPSSFGTEGEYVDAEGAWIYTFLGDALRFAEALGRIGGPNLFADERLGRVGHFLAKYRDMDAPGWQGITDHEHAAVFAVLAREYQDPQLQYYVTQGGPFARSWNAPDWGLRRYGAATSVGAAPGWSYLTIEWNTARRSLKLWVDSVLMEYQLDEAGAMPPDRLVIRSLDPAPSPGASLEAESPASADALRSADSSTSAGSSLGVEVASVHVYQIGPGGASTTPEPVFAADFPPAADRVPDFVAGESRLVLDPSGHFRYLELDAGATASIDLPRMERGVVRVQLRRAGSGSRARIELASGGEAIGALTFAPEGAAVSILGKGPRPATGEAFDTRQYPGVYNSALWEFLWLDSALAAAPPPRDRASKYFADLGQVWMRTGWGPHEIEVRFRSGPEIGKDHGDQNGFTMRAFGQDILPELVPPSVGLNQLQYDLYGWYWGSPGHNVIIVDGENISDADSFAATGRISVQGGIQVDQNEWRGPQPGRRYPAEWLAPGDATKGRVVGVLLSPAYNYVAGEAHRAYVRAVPLDWWLRQLMLIGPGDGAPPYVVVHDDVRTPGGRLSRIDWQLHTFREPVVVEGNRVLMSRNDVHLVTTLLLPEPVEIEVKRAPAGTETPFIQARPPGKQSLVRYLAVLQPLRGTAEASLELERIEGTNADGVIARPKAGGSVEDTAIFRRSIEPQPAAAGGVEADGLAAFVRTVDGTLRLFALHQGTALAWEGRPLVAADKPVDVAVEFEQDAARVTVRANGETRLALSVEHRPASLPDGASYDPDRGTVDISVDAGERILEIAL